MVYEETFTNFKANQAGDWATRPRASITKLMHLSPSLTTLHFPNI